MTGPRDFGLRPQEKIQYARDHPLPDTDSDTSVEYYEQEKETASDFELEEESDEEGQTADGERADTSAAVNMPPNQSNPLVPFAVVPGHVANDPRRHVVCPVCPAGHNEFSNGSMSLHFNRRHRALFAQVFGVPPPPLYPCPYHGGFGCTAPSFKKQGDREDHLSEAHNVVPARWRLNFMKQKRRKHPSLMADHIAEATTLNALIDRILVAEARQHAPYASQHGLPLVHFEAVHDRITNPLATAANKKLDLAAKLIALRRAGDQRGVLLDGGMGTWEQVAGELEARVPAVRLVQGLVVGDGTEDEDEDAEGDAE